MIQADANEGRDARQESEPLRAERLALLYQGMLTAIVRIQSGKQPLTDANTFQKRMESLLDEIEQALHPLLERIGISEWLFPRLDAHNGRQHSLIEQRQPLGP